MGTRGCYGFFKNGENKLTYNHFDSYFSGLGKDIMEFCQKTNIKELNEMFNKIIMVDESDTPTQEQINECKQYADLTVGEQKVEDWYCLLRDTQGNLDVYKKDLRYMIDNKEFMANSLFCEYAYIINLDTNELEIYVGFNKVPQNNRYSQFVVKDEFDDRGYVECKLIKTYSLVDFPKDIEKEIEMLEKIESYDFI